MMSESPASSSTADTFAGRSAPWSNDAEQGLARRAAERDDDPRPDDVELAMEVRKAGRHLIG